MKRRAFEALVQASLDGTCTESELRSLEVELMGSEARRHDFREAYLLHEMLDLEASSDSPGVGAAKVIPMEAILRRQRFREFRVALVAAAAVVMFAAVIMGVIHSQVAPAPLRITAAPHSSLRVTDATGQDCSLDRIEPGARVDLREGTLELELSSGVRAIVQAPTRFTFVTPLRLRMDAGTGRFRVPRKARGFTVSTPDVDVVDLGTDFGILNQTGKLPQLHVFEGRVRISARRGAKESAVVDAGNAVRAGIAGRLEATELKSGLFYQELPTDLPFVRLSFEQDEDGSLEVEGSHPAVSSMVARLSEDGPSIVDGVIGKAAHFSGGPTPVATDWEGVSGAIPRTIAAWIRVDKNPTDQKFQTIAGWGDPTIGMAGKCELLLFRPNPDKATVLRLSFDQFIFSGTTGLADGEWHHVAAIWRENPDNELKPVVQLFVDGRRESLDLNHSMVELDRIHGPRTLTHGERSMPFVVGYTDRPQVNRGFHGDIDEVMVFEAALDETRIRKLAIAPDTD